MTPTTDLDAVVRMTSRRVWALVLAVLVVLGAAGAWATLVHVESALPLDGVLLSGPGPDLVRAPADARVVQLPVPAGTVVQTGTAVAVLDAGGRRTSLLSPGDGVVSSVVVSVGQAVAGGTPLVVVDHAGAPLHAVLLAGAATVVPVGTPVRGPGLSGHVVAADPYPRTPAQLAARYGLSAIPGAGTGLVRAVLVDLGRPSWTGATGTPVRLGLIVARQRPLDMVLHGGAA
jgi:multidrug efflux pump subunit AcrA (membrane-fusion protein)